MTASTFKDLLNRLMEMPLISKMVVYQPNKTLFLLRNQVMKYVKLSQIKLVVKMSSKVVLELVKIQTHTQELITMQL